MARVQHVGDPSGHVYAAGAQGLMQGAEWMMRVQGMKAKTEQDRQLLAKRLAEYDATREQVELRNEELEARTKVQELNFRRMQEADTREENARVAEREMQDSLFDRYGGQFQGETPGGLLPEQAGPEYLGQFPAETAVLGTPSKLGLVEGEDYESLNNLVTRKTWDQMDVTQRGVYLSTLQERQDKIRRNAEAQMVDGYYRQMLALGHEFDDQEAQAFSEMWQGVHEGTVEPEAAFQVLEAKVQRGSTQRADMELRQRQAADAREMYDLLKKYGDFDGARRALELETEITSDPRWRPEAYQQRATEIPTASRGLARFGMERGFKSGVQAGAKMAQRGPAGGQVYDPNAGAATAPPPSAPAPTVRGAGAVGAQGSVTFNADGLIEDGQALYRHTEPGDPGAKGADAYLSKEQIGEAKLVRKVEDAFRKVDRAYGRGDLGEEEVQKKMLAALQENGLAPTPENLMLFLGWAKEETPKGGGPALQGWAGKAQKNLPDHLKNQGGAAGASGEDRETAGANLWKAAQSQVSPDEMEAAKAAARAAGFTEDYIRETIAFARDSLQYSSAKGGK